MTFLYIMLSSILGGTVATIFMSMFFLSKNADENAYEINRRTSLPIRKELTEIIT